MQPDEGNSMQCSSGAAEPCQPAIATVVPSSVDSSEASPQQLSARQLAGSVHGLAKARHQPTPIWMRRFLEASEQQLIHGAFTTQEMSMMMWGLAKLKLPMDQRPCSQWLHQFCRAALSKADSFKPQELSTVVWAIATMQLQPAKQWVQAWLVACSNNIQHFSPYDLSQTVWALATMGHQPSSYWLDKVVAAADRLGNKFNPQVRYA